MYVFSTIDKQSFIDIDGWKARVEKICGKNIASVLVQNKIDLYAQKAVEE